MKRGEKCTRCSANNSASAVEKNKLKKEKKNQTEMFKEQIFTVRVLHAILLINKFSLKNLRYNAVELTLVREKRLARTFLASLDEKKKKK